MAKTPSSYDTIPYPSLPFPETHPDRLSAVARIFGLEAPDLANCRVLELGCSMGGNLVAIAQNHPGSRCVGIDASAHQITEGWKTIESLGIKNVELRHMDILDIDDSLGEFDYILTHGVFSWVPERVQNKLLEICRRNLARNGVAYISYNTYPGWHIRGIVRDMMFYRGMQFSDAGTRLAQARSLVEFVAQSSPGSSSPYQKLLQGELKQLGRMSDYYLHHEYLEDHNQPLYFHDFAKKLAVSGLQYLGDADFSMMISTNFSAEIAKTLHELGAHDILQMEQYMDFVRCRYFRKSLVCHGGIRLKRAISGDSVKDLLLASGAAPAEELALDPEKRITFETAAGSRLMCKAPLTKLALGILQREWPMPVAFADLLARSKQEAAAKGYPADESTAENFLAGEILTAIGSGLVEWRISEAPYTTTIGPRPAASPLARLQATQEYRATNLRGEMITLDEIHRQTLRQLDGSRTVAEVVEAMVGELKAGVFKLHAENDKQPVTDEAAMRKLLAPALDKVLRNLSRQAFLVRSAA
ncbi:MAG TPA: class I SAM-dependent methyltransferase [Burkholderiales bacterium]